MLVLSAAAAASRTQKDVPTEKANRKSLMIEYLERTDEILDVDRQLADNIKAYFDRKTFKIIAGGYVGNFEREAMKALNEEETTAYKFGLIATLPGVYTSGIERERNEVALKQATGGYIGKIGDRIELKITVKKCIYSRNWNTYYINALTENDEAVFFSFKEDVVAGTQMQIKGTIKAHRDNSTQLNRVRV